MSDIHEVRSKFEMIHPMPSNMVYCVDYHIYMGRYPFDGDGWKCASDEDVKAYNQLWYEFYSGKAALEIMKWLPKNIIGDMDNALLSVEYDGCDDGWDHVRSVILGFYEFKPFDGLNTV